MSAKSAIFFVRHNIGGKTSIEYAANAVGLVSSVWILLGFAI